MQIVTEAQFQNLSLQVEYGVEEFRQLYKVNDKTGVFTEEIWGYQVGHIQFLRSPLTRSTRTYSESGFHAMKFTLGDWKRLEI